MAAALLNHEDHTEEDLCRIMEWHKDPAVLYRAIGILEENRFNVFRMPVFEEGAEDAG